MSVEGIPENNHQQVESTNGPSEGEFNPMEEFEDVRNTVSLDAASLALSAVIRRRDYFHNIVRGLKKEDENDNDVIDGLMGLPIRGLINREGLYSFDIPYLYMLDRWNGTPTSEWWYPFQCALGEIQERTRIAKYRGISPQRLPDFVIFPNQPRTSEILKYLESVAHGNGIPIITYTDITSAAAAKAYPLDSQLRTLFEPSAEQYRFHKWEVDKLIHRVIETGVPLAFDTDRIFDGESDKSRSLPDGRIFGLSPISDDDIEALLRVSGCFHFNPRKNDHELLNDTMNGQTTRLSEIIDIAKSVRMDWPIVIQYRLPVAMELTDPQGVSLRYREISTWLREKMHSHV